METVKRSGVARVTRWGRVRGEMIRQNTKDFLRGALKTFCMIP